MKIRKASNTDIPQLIQLIIDYKTSQNLIFNNDQIEKMRSSLKNSVNGNINILIVSLNSKEDSINGYLNMHMIDFPLIQGKELYISDLVIKEEKRGKGHGTELLNYAKNFAQEQNCVRIMLNNFKESQAYIRGFYKKKGFLERENFANFVMIL